MAEGLLEGEEVRRKRKEKVQTGSNVTSPEGEMSKRASFTCIWKTRRLPSFVWGGVGLGLRLRLDFSLGSGSVQGLGKEHPWKPLQRPQKTHFTSFSQMGPEIRAIPTNKWVLLHNY